MFARRLLVSASLGLLRLVGLPVHALVHPVHYYDVLLLHVVVSSRLMIPVAQAVRVLPRRSRNKQQQAAAAATTITTTTTTLHRRLLSLQDTLQQQRLLRTKQAAQQQQQQRRRRQGKAAVHVDIPDSPDGHLVHAGSLPLLDSGFTTKQWAGHLPASPDDGDKYFFYWLFEPEIPDNFAGKETEIPLLIWLNGGPGCSSMDGLFLENGPFRLVMNENTKQYQMQTDPYSWHKLPAYTLYIDQPVGTGLSFTTSGQYPSNDDLLNKDFYYFLQFFLNFHADKFVENDSSNNNNSKEQQQQQQVIPETSRPLYFSGESYAGHYQGIFVNYILKQNDLLSAQNQQQQQQQQPPKRSSSSGGKTQKEQRNIRINVAGAAIGNGWVDPFYQYSGAEAAYGHGLIGFPEVFAYQEKEKQCQKGLKKGRYNQGICFDLIDDLVDQSKGIDSDYAISSYDIRRVEPKHGDRFFPPGHKVIDTYLGGWPLRRDQGNIPAGVDKAARKALHAEAADLAGQRYKECTDPPYNALSYLDGKGIVRDLVEILEHRDNVELLFFNGIMDMVCNHVGNEKALEHLPWKHQADFNTAHRYAWMAPNETMGKVSGYMREFKNLMFLKIMDAGHMVPLDVPHVAFEMMKTFVYQGSFQASQQQLDRSIQKDDECPVCPACPTDDGKSSTQDTSSYPQQANGIVITYPWITVGAFIGAILLVVTLVRRKRRFRPVTTASSLDYDMELRESSQYSDSPMESMNGNGETREVI